MPSKKHRSVNEHKTKSRTRQERHAFCQYCGIRIIRRTPTECLTVARLRHYQGRLHRTIVLNILRSAVSKFEDAVSKTARESKKEEEYVLTNGKILFLVSWLNMKSFLDTDIYVDEDYHWCHTWFYPTGIAQEVDRSTSVSSRDKSVVRPRTGFDHQSSDSRANRGHIPPHETSLHDHSYTKTNTGYSSDHVVEKNSDSCQTETNFAGLDHSNQTSYDHSAMSVSMTTNGDHCHDQTNSQRDPHHCVATTSNDPPRIETNQQHPLSIVQTYEDPTIFEMIVGGNPLLVEPDLDANPLYFDAYLYDGPPTADIKQLENLPIVTTTPSKLVDPKIRSNNHENNNPTSSDNNPILKKMMKKKTPTLETASPNGLNVTETSASNPSIAELNKENSSSTEVASNEDACFNGAADNGAFSKRASNNISCVGKSSDSVGTCVELGSDKTCTTDSASNDVLHTQGTKEHRHAADTGSKYDQPYIIALNKYLPNSKPSPMSHKGVTKNNAHDAHSTEAVLYIDMLIDYSPTSEIASNHVFHPEATKKNTHANDTDLNTQNNTECTLANGTVSTDHMSCIDRLDERSFKSETALKVSDTERYSDSVEPNMEQNLNKIPCATDATSSNTSRIKATKNNTHANDTDSKENMSSIEFLDNSFKSETSSKNTHHTEDTNNITHANVTESNEGLSCIDNFPPNCETDSNNVCYNTDADCALGNKTDSNKDLSCRNNRSLYSKSSSGTCFESDASTMEISDDENASSSASSNNELKSDILVLKSPINQSSTDETTVTTVTSVMDTTPGNDVSYFETSINSNISMVETDSYFGPIRADASVNNNTSCIPKFPKNDPSFIETGGDDDDWSVCGNKDEDSSNTDTTLQTSPLTLTAPKRHSTPKSNKGTVLLRFPNNKILFRQAHHSYSHQAKSPELTQMQDSSKRSSPQTEKFQSPESLVFTLPKVIHSTYPSNSIEHQLSESSKPLNSTGNHEINYSNSVERNERLSIATKSTLLEMDSPAPSKYAGAQESRSSKTPISSPNDAKRQSEGAKYDINQENYSKATTHSSDADTNYQEVLIASSSMFHDIQQCTELYEGVFSCLASKDNQLEISFPELMLGAIRRINSKWPNAKPCEVLLAILMSSIEDCANVMPPEKEKWDIRNDPECSKLYKAVKVDWGHMLNDIRIVRYGEVHYTMPSYDESMFRTFVHPTLRSTHLFHSSVVTAQVLLKIAQFRLHIAQKTLGWEH